MQPTLVVERFINVWPGEICGAPLATANLEDTYWKLTHLGTTAVIVADRQREPHLVLRSQDRRLGGSGGCNRLLGSYELDGDTLTFGQMAATKMACGQGMDTETSFLEVLTQVKTWKIVGEHLELFDASGHLLARRRALCSDDADEGALETGLRDGLRHRHRAKSRRQQRLPVPTLTTPVLYSTHHWLCRMGWPIRPPALTTLVLSGCGQRVPGGAALFEYTRE